MGTPLIIRASTFPTERLNLSMPGISHCLTCPLFLPLSLEEATSFLATRLATSSRPSPSYFWISYWTRIPVAGEGQLKNLLWFHCVPPFL